MHLPKTFTTVTPLSKTLALLLFISLPFMGFYLGVRYQQAIQETKQYTQIPTLTIIPTPVVSETSCQTDNDCVLYDTNINCCGSGTSCPADETQASYIAVNKIWFDKNYQQQRLRCREIMCPMIMRECLDSERTDILEKNAHVHVKCNVGMCEKESK